MTDPSDILSLWLGKNSSSEGTEDPINLDGFLEHARSSGLKVDEGQFTLSRSQATRKMALYSLPYPEAWVLKVVQAAVVWNVEKIVVRQTRLTTTFEFCPEALETLPTEREMVATIMGLSEGGRIAVEKLGLALRTLVQSSGYSFILLINDGTRQARPLYAGHDIEKMPKRARIKLSKRKFKGVRLVVSHLRDGEFFSGRLLGRFLPWVRRDLEIALELEKNACACPIPLTLDGRVLNHLFQHPKFGFLSDSRPLLLAGVKIEGHAILPLAVDGEQKVMSYLTDPRRAERKYNRLKHFSGWFLCRGEEPPHPMTTRLRTHEILWVSDGVFVHREGFRLSTNLLTLSIFLNADDLQTDLTGLALQDSEAKQERLQTYLRAIGRELQECAIHVSHFFEPDEDAFSGEDRAVRQVLSQQESGKRLVRSLLPGLKKLRQKEPAKNQTLFQLRVPDCQHSRWQTSLESDFDLLSSPESQIVHIIKRPVKETKTRQVKSKGAVSSKYIASFSKSSSGGTQLVMKPNPRFEE